ncbi:IclR family transcriptional regulator [Amycolatopsis thermophila]|uniref:DNA-binding IclR family transcriptional regulator n=1 Tax=Amycolatopsis thermophila TaxID=206084 RepID=A0ABU0F583_9PSEU|nr:helix-turn-helix domain-containing protein [Amycolatopsis thermophila]MDQ0382207.1 DNA-binding IclR family transcriptional regulator [Amycolatopsis thermophila]
MAEGKVVGGAGLQTLERGLSVLEAVAEHAPCTTATVAEVTGLHRSIAYRVLCTLEARGYLQRDRSGRYEVGLAVLTVASAVRSDLQTLAQTELSTVAEATGTVAFLAVPHGDEALTLVTAEPPAAATPVSYRPGVRHALTRGAPGLAILAALPPRPDERPEVALARDLGHVRTTGEVVPGISALAVPVRLRAGRVASASVLFVAGRLDEQSALTHLHAAAERLDGR